MIEKTYKEVLEQFDFDYFDFLSYQVFNCRYFIGLAKAATKSKNYALATVYLSIASIHYYHAERMSIMGDILEFQVPPRFVN